MLNLEYKAVLHETSACLYLEFKITDENYCKEKKSMQKELLSPLFIVSYCKIHLRLDFSPKFLHVICSFLIFPFYELGIIL